MCFVVSFFFVEFVRLLPMFVQVFAVFGHIKTLLN